MNLRWFGWGTFRLTIPGGPTLLVDPCVSPLLADAHASPSDLVGADAILFTHGHHEHIKDAARVARLLPRAPILAPAQVREYLVAQRGLSRARFVAAVPGEETELAGASVRSYAFPHLPKHDVAGKLDLLRRGAPLRSAALIARFGLRIAGAWLQIRNQPEFGPFLAYDVRAGGRRVVFTCEAFTELLDPAEVLRWAESGPPVDLAVVGVESGQESAAAVLTEALRPARAVGCPVHAPFERFYGKPPVVGAAWVGDHDGWSFLQPGEKVSV